ncbi:MAG TPA: lamin tail domain-containing protein [Phycisphaerales bacterium]|nr:lamin tail domain-containing protein [Phycisphaerales bacterium]
MIIAPLFVVAVAQPKAPPAKNPVAPSAPALSAPDPAKPLLPFPHPLITEVLYNVPTGDLGDANRDGTRQVAGDEFVELVNPHDKPINLGGYTLSDMTAQEKTGGGKPKSGAIHWTFPPLMLKPGQAVVVFNGHASTIAGPLGDSSGAPPKGNDAFKGATVFSMRQPTDRVGFANTADWVMLSAPGGRPVHIIKWGEPRVKPPADVLLVEDAPTARNGSIQRTAANGPLAAHPNDAGAAYSPGFFAMPTPAEPAIEKEPAKPTKPDASKGTPPTTEPVKMDPPKPPEEGEKPASSKKPKF